MECWSAESTKILQHSITPFGIMPIAVRDQEF